MKNATLTTQETLKQMIDAFKDRLSAAYMLGSFARDTPSKVSDVDFAIILKAPISKADEASVNCIIAEIQKMNLDDYSTRLSVFWGSVESLNAASSIGRFPPLDRLDLIQNGKLLHGNDIRKHLIQPTQCELITASAEFALERLSMGKINQAIMQPELFFPMLDDVYLTKIILMPVRLLYTALTGEIGHNDASVAYYLQHFPGPSAKLVAAAFCWRTESPQNKAKTILPLLENNSLRALYQQFIEYYIAELIKLKTAPELITQMTLWHSRLALKHAEIKENKLC